MFKVKKSTKMEKVFATYAGRKGVNVDSLRFLLDGNRIQKEQTAADLDLEDDDQVCACTRTRIDIYTHV
jgi:small ubiquitin-related modifier